MKQIAVVTGAGTGVGRAVAIELARRGYSVAILGRTEATLNETAKLAGGKTIAIRCDVGVEADVRAMGKRVRAELGLPEVIVNAAGTNLPERSLDKLTTEAFRRLVDINLNGAFFVIHEFLADFRAAGRGTIVNVVSDAGLIANRFSGAAYAASKFGLVGLSQTINAEERSNGIRCCAVCPGEIDTPLLKLRPVEPSAEARRKMLQPEDVAACVLLAIELTHRATVEQLIVRPRVL